MRAICLARPQCLGLRVRALHAKETKNHGLNVWLAGACGDLSGASDLGSTYAWGRNDNGQLGLGHRDDRWTPQVVSSWTLLSYQGSCLNSSASPPAALASVPRAVLFI